MSDQSTAVSNPSQSSSVPQIVINQPVASSQPGPDDGKVIVANIQQSLTNFSKLYYQSDPAKFRFIWQQHVAPIELLDVMIAICENHSAPSSSKEKKGTAKQVQPAVLPPEFDAEEVVNKAMKAPVPASEPNVASIGYTLPAMYLEKATVPTKPPSFISLYINKSRILDYGDFFPVTIASPSIFQPAAPVAPTNMAALLDGIDLRADIPCDHHAFAYIFSYPWNDAMVVIHNDQPGCYVTVNGVDQPCQEKRKKGWACLMKDVEDAAKGGNRVWRLKVIVLYGTLLDKDEGTTTMIV